MFSYDGYGGFHLFISGHLPAALGPQSAQWVASVLTFRLPCLCRYWLAADCIRRGRRVRQERKSASRDFRFPPLSVRYERRMSDDLVAVQNDMRQPSGGGSLRLH